MQKQAEVKMDSLKNPQNYNFNQFLHGKFDVQFELIFNIEISFTVDFGWFVAFESIDIFCVWN